MRNATAFGLALLLSGCGACGRAKDGVKDAINKGGEIAGQTAGEFIKGAKEGVEETFAVNVELGERVQALGITTGQTRATSGEQSTTTNQLDLYLIFSADISDTLLVKAFDADHLEMGRATLPISGTRNGAGWFTITFPEQTDLESKGSVVLE